MISETEREIKRETENKATQNKSGIKKKIQTIHASTWQPRCNRHIFIKVNLQKCLKEEMENMNMVCLLQRNCISNQTHTHRHSLDNLITKFYQLFKV